MSNFDWKFDWSKKEYNESLDEDAPYEKVGKISVMKVGSSMQDFLNRVFNSKKAQKLSELDLNQEIETSPKE